MSQNDLGGHSTENDAGCDGKQNKVVMTKNGRVGRYGPEIEGSNIDRNRHVLNEHRFEKGLFLTFQCLVHGEKATVID